MVQYAELVRLEQGEEGTFGVLRLNGSVFCVTLEPPAKKNRINVSCIPTGEYRCKKVNSPKFGTTYEVVGVPGRSHILLHAGNVVKDTSGCVLLGNHFGKLQEERGVLDSGTTFARFMDMCGGVESFPLVVENACGEGPCNQFA